MKIAMMIVSASLFLSATSFACEGTDEFKGKEDARKAVGEKMTCISNGTTSDGGAWRVKNTDAFPVYAVLKAFDKELKVQSVKQVSETSFEIIAADKGILLCQISQDGAFKKICS